jgi:hypothetical protein
MDELDDARINSELLEIEVEAGRQQLKQMMAVLNETELQEIQGFSRGPVLSGNTGEERQERIKNYKSKYAEVRDDFVSKSKALARERRRVAELENQLHLTVAPPSPTSAERPWKDAMQVLDLILKGVDTWQRSSSPTPAPSTAPDDPSSKDSQRLLDLIRKGVETWQGAPTPSPSPSPSPSPRPSPDDPSLKDAERILDLIRKGVEAWQGSSTPSPSPMPSPAPTPRPVPSPSPVEPPSRDAERVLELILRGVESLQRQ